MNIDRRLFTDDWRFALTDDARATLSAYDDSAFRKLDLPHDWQIEQARTPDAPGGGAQGFFPREHVGVYRKRFFAPADMRGKRVTLMFDGVQRFSTVYLNDKRVGGRPYGYVPFECELDDALIYGGENVLAVRVDNTIAPNETLASGDRWYSGAGIYRNVWLLTEERARINHNGVRVVTQPVHRGPSRDVPDVKGIKCDLAHISVSVETEAAGEGHTLRVDAFEATDELYNVLRAPEAAPRAQTEALYAPIISLCAPACARVEFAFDIVNPRLWSPDAPEMYILRVTLYEGERALSTHIVRFGVRSAVFDDEDGFLLNGEKLKLYGVNLHHDGGAVGAAVPYELNKRRLLAIKALGANTVRAAHNPFAEEFYELCDELGLMVIDEIYDKWADNCMYYDRFFEKWYAEDISSMIRRDANHPSVILWSVGNELSYQYSELFYKRLKALCELTRALDPTRGVTCALIGFVLADYHDRTPMGKKLNAVLRYAEIVDVFSGNYMEHFYEKLRAAGMRKPIIGSEVRNYYRLDEKALDSVTVSNESPFAICEKHDWVCGALIWAGVDYLGESSGWSARGWTGNLLDSTCDWKLRAWYCAAHWLKKPVLKLAVYDEREPWDMARGMWSFPQMRSHWNYTQYEKIMHVAVMTNCDTVKIYQNSQTSRTACRKDFPDGMIHFFIPFLPGVLRAEGYIGNMLVAQDVLTSDHEPEALSVVADTYTLKADGRSVAIVDVLLSDKRGRRYMLTNPLARYEITGGARILCADNGDALSTTRFDAPECPLFNGHLMLVIRAGRERGEARLILSVEGFEKRELVFSIT